MSSTDAATFHTTHLFRASRPAVWDAWTKPDWLAQWMGPVGTTTTILRSELRPGGMLHFRMDLPDGGAMWGRFIYREIVPPARLVWLHAFGDAEGRLVRAPFDATWPLEMLTSVTFAEEGPATRVTLTMAPIGATVAEAATFAAGLSSMQGGWGGSFDKLDRLLPAV